jgi:hypothetical protein
MKRDCCRNKQLPSRIDGGKASTTLHFAVQTYANCSDERQQDHLDIIKTLVDPGASLDVSIWIRANTGDLESGKFNLLTPCEIGQEHAS